MTSLRVYDDGHYELEGLIYSTGSEETSTKAVVSGLERAINLGVSSLKMLVPNGSITTEARSLMNLIPVCWYE